MRKAIVRAAIALCASAVAVSSRTAGAQTPPQPPGEEPDFGESPPAAPKPPPPKPQPKTAKPPPKEPPAAPTQPAVAAPSSTVPAATETDFYDVTLSGGVGLGLQIGSAAGRSVAKPTPAFLLIDVGYARFDRIEGTVSFFLPVIGTVGLAVMPGLRVHIPSASRLKPYVLGGVPVFVSPYTMVGIEAGAGANIVLSARLEAFVESMFDAFFLGTDLPNNRAVFQWNVRGGLRVRL